MDGIQAYTPIAQPAPRPVIAPVALPTSGPVAVVPTLPSGPSPASLKTPGNYLGAIRRRAWLVGLIALPIATLGTLMVLRLPAVYSVQAIISVETPKTSPAIRSLIGASEVIGGDSGTSTTYVQTTLALLNTRSFLNEALNNKELGLPPSILEAGDPAAEMVGKIKTRTSHQSSNVVVTYEGRDPELITRVLHYLLTKFRDRADRESRQVNVEAADQASKQLTVYAKTLEDYDTKLADMIRTSHDIAPNGHNMSEAEHESLRQQAVYLQNQVATLQMDTLRPQPLTASEQIRAQKIAELEATKKPLQKRLAHVRRVAANPLGDPAVTRAQWEIREVDEQIAALQQGGTTGHLSAAEDFSQEILARAMANLQATQERMDRVMTRMRESIPDYQNYTKTMADREIAARQVATLREKLDAFRIVSNAQKKPVEIIDLPDTPTLPVRPNRPIYIAGAIVFSLMTGLALVCLLEHIDHSVRVPEHLTAGLALPLFGVVPRMIRSSRNHRGGHLWTSGTPDSVEADAYRNLRASLLGAIDGRGAISTLLITSAKAGEGKSTTALNLAATCARAGERTLLIDVDLRRPSLNGVFPAQDHDRGLVDVLRGDLPWQRTIVQTDLPNLDFLPTGVTRDVPIEVLGSLELRQLLLSLAQNHYDRVILDGPAVLGLADCRMLGRIVDAAVLVVRSGSQEIRSLQRAKAMLEQSQVYIAGLVFNGLCDDLANWSSYGPNPLVDPPAGLARSGSRRAAALTA